MTKLKTTTGYFKNGLPYACIGRGQHNLVIFGGGPDFDHKPPSGFQLRMMSGWFQGLAEDFTIYMVSRKPNLPISYSTRDMSNDYAVMIREELRFPVDIMGLSSGGPIAQHFAVDHPGLVRRLVLAETGYSLSEEGKELTRQIGDLMRQGKWRQANMTMVTFVLRRGIKKYVFKLIMWLFGKFISGIPADPSGGLVEVDAEINHDFKERLAEIKVPTLVIGGEEDHFYPIRETAEGIPNAKLILYKGLGHDAIMKRQFSRDVLAFLTEGSA